jgi:PKD repeat protein
MKKVMMFGLMFLLVAIFVSASFTVHNYSFGGSFSPYENITGSLNISIDSGSFISKITSSEDEEILLGDFLDENFADYDCTPQDCSSDYNFQSPESQKIVSMTSGESSYIGFVLDGTEVRVNNIYFDISSDFPRESEIPIFLTLFERDIFEFTIFSNESSPRNYGCYDSSNAVAGHLIGYSEYCEVIEIPVTNSIKMGSIVELNGETKDLKMSLYPASIGYEIDGCVFNPSIDPSGCIIDAPVGDTFNEGTYHVCVNALSSPTDYKIFEEAEEDVCGFIFANGAQNNVIDYGIFVQSAYYEAASGFLNSSTIDFSSLKLTADSYIENKYNRDCSNSCILPIELVGVSQDFIIDSISISYFDGDGDINLNAVSDLDITPAVVDFNGVLDISKTGFSIESTGNYSLYLNGEQLFEEYVTLLSVPFASDLNPLNVPAGITVLFTIQDSYNGGEIVEYIWDFGDGTIFTTSNTSAPHTYDLIKNYTIEITSRISDGLESSSIFVVESVSPETAVNTTLTQKNLYLESFSDELDSLDSFLENKIRTDSSYDSFVGELKSLQSLFDDYSTEAELVNLAKDVYDLDVPIDLESFIDVSLELAGDVNSFNPFVVAEIEDFSLQNVEEYKSIMFNWQTANTISQIYLTDYVVLFSSGNKEPVARSYVVDVSSFDEELSYIVLGPFNSEVKFKDSNYVTTSDGSYVFELAGRGHQTLTIYTESSENLEVFVSPGLSTLVVDGEIDETCNFNAVCESENGENSNTCRNDCLPTQRIFFFSVAVILFILLLYIFLAWWYERNYETHLFNDRRQLYNLLMFVTNARSNNISERDISSALKKQSWSKERITYVLRKSAGKRTGLPQVFLITWITLYVRKRKAKKLLNSTQTLIPPRQIVSNRFPQQNRFIPPIKKNSSFPIKRNISPRQKIQKKSGEESSSATQNTQKK